MTNSRYFFIPLGEQISVLAQFLSMTCKFKALNPVFSENNSIFLKLTVSDLLPEQPKIQQGMRMVGWMRRSLESVRKVKLVFCLLDCAKILIHSRQSHVPVIGVGTGGAFGACDPQPF